MYFRSWFSLTGRDYVTPCALDRRDHVYWNEKGLRGSQTCIQKPWFVEFCVVPPFPVELLFRYLQKGPFNIHSTSRPSQCLTVFNSQDLPHNFQGPVKKENAEPLVKKSLRIIWWQMSLKPSKGPFWAGDPVWLHRSHPMQSAVPTAYSLVGFHCLSCFLSACPASGPCGEKWVSCSQRHTGYQVAAGCGQGGHRLTALGGRDRFGSFSQAKWVVFHNSYIHFERGSSEG